MIYVTVRPDLKTYYENNKEYFIQRNVCIADAMLKYAGKIIEVEVLGKGMCLGYQYKQPDGRRSYFWIDEWLVQKEFLNEEEE